MAEQTPQYLNDIAPEELLVHVDSILELTFNAGEYNINRTASVALLLKDVLDLLEQKQ